jgi:DNA-binding SARP family transcriptional activator
METATRFAILGPLHLQRGKHNLTVNATKQRIILAKLLLSANQVVMADELTELLWPDRMPRYTRASLQTHVARLRSALDRCSDDDHRLIHTTPGGYLIEVSSEQLDLLHYRALMDRATQEQAAGDLLGELRLLEDGLALWRGTPLADISSDALQRDEVPQLTEEWFRALHRRFDIQLLLGNHEQIVPDLSRLVQKYPLREHLCGQLMVALFRCGRQAEALDAYASVSAVLRHEYGLDAGDELRRLHHAVLTGDPTLATRLVPHAAGPPPAAALWTVPRQLPGGVGDFVGRESVLRDAEDLLCRDRPAAAAIVAVTGPPGVGKTALALQLAHHVQGRFPDGQMYVRLGQAGERPRDPTDVLAELLEATGVSRVAVPAGREQRAAMFRSRLADRRVLLVLDDALDVEQVRPLLPGAPSCAVVITSRRLLSTLAGTFAIRLTSLAENESLRLLGLLAGSGRIAREPTAARRIAAACGDLPLALRIAGARLAAQPAVSLAAFADRLRDGRRLDELQAGDLDMRRSLERSYLALDPPARAVFRRLGLLREREIEPWMASVLDDDGDERAADHLIEASLLEPAGLSAMGDPVYRLHPLSALYAAALAEQDDPASAEAALRRYVDAMLDLAVRACGQLPRAVGQLPSRPVTGGTESTAGAADSGAPAGHVESRPWRWLSAQRCRLLGLVRQCRRYGWHERAERLAETVVSLARHRDDLPELVQSVVTVREAGGDSGDQLTRWRAEYSRATLLIRGGRIAEAHALLSRCAAAFRRLRAHQELAYTLAARSHVSTLRAAPREALEFCGQALDLARSTGDAHAETLALAAAADTQAALGQTGEAGALYQDVLHRSRESGETRLEAVALHRLGWYSLDEGDLESAGALAGRARALPGVGDRYGEARPLELLGAVALRRGRHADAMALAEHGRRVFARLGDACGEAEATCLQAEIHIAAGRADDAIDLLCPTLVRLDDLGAVQAWERAGRVLTRARAALDGHPSPQGQEACQGGNRQDPMWAGPCSAA